MPGPADKSHRRARRALLMPYAAVATTVSLLLGAAVTKFVVKPRGFPSTAASLAGATLVFALIIGLSGTPIIRKIRKNIDKHH